MLIPCDIKNILQSDFDLQLFIKLIEQGESKINKSLLAKELDISRPTLYTKLEIINSTELKDLQDLPELLFKNLNNLDIKIFIFLSLCYHCNHNTFIKEISQVCNINLNCNYQKNYDKINSSLNKLQELDYINLSESKTFISVIKTVLNLEVKENNLSLIKSNSPIRKSSGEFIVSSLLERNSIPYIREKVFNNLIDIKNLRYDFFINNQYLLEVDGKQHFEPIDFFGGEKYFSELKRHDEIKNNFAKENFIPLIRIPYYALNNLKLEDIQIGSKYQITF